jgi:uncharacterized protein
VSRGGRLNTMDMIARIAGRIQDKMHGDSSGHDWCHVQRVRKLAVRLGEREGADIYVVELAALLHDVSDYKFNGGDQEEGPRIARAWLLEFGETDSCARTVAEIVAGVSFRGAGTIGRMTTIEGMVVQDADRLDAIGAIGVARAFAYGACTQEPMFDPDRAPRLHATQAEYFARSGSTISHFYEKLLLLKDRMNTDSARLVAQRRHCVLEEFLKNFLAEWDGDDIEEADSLP